MKSCKRSAKKDFQIFPTTVGIMIWVDIKFSNMEKLDIQHRKECEIYHNRLHDDRGKSMNHNANRKS